MTLTNKILLLGFFATAICFGIFLKGTHISLFSLCPHNHQSAAQFGNYAFFVTDKRSKICIYDLQNRQMVSVITLKKEEERDYTNKAILYHCNQTSFGTKYYSPNDVFPLLYISQRAGADQRCFTEVYRICLETNDTTDKVNYTVQLVQTIHFPPMSVSNSMGNVNVVINSTNNKLYTYSRNNDSKADNYLKCKITCFPIPDINISDVYLEDKDILYSFYIDCSALYMQGACINNGILYIGQGIKTPELRIVDLEKKKLKQTIQLKDFDYIYEPEGCFWYDGKLYLSSAKYIHIVTFD